LEPTAYAVGYLMARLRRWKSKCRLLAFASLRSE
jgi:hypothetical protein